MIQRSKLKHLLYNFSILFFALSFFSSSVISSTDSTILKTQNKNIPNHLFDVSFELYKTQIGDIEQLRGHGTFENFGQETTDLKYTLILYDNNVKKITSIEKTVTVQTEQFLSFDFDEFKDLELMPGKYTVVLSTLYDEDTKDIFVQDFYISNFYNPSTQFVTFIVFSILIFICLFLIIFEVKHSKNKREKKLLIREYIVERKNIKKRMK